MGYRQVSSDEFYDAIGDLDVWLHTIGPWPYKTEFREKSNRRLVGYSQGYELRPGVALDKYYYLLEES